MIARGKQKNRREEEWIYAVCYGNAEHAPHPVKVKCDIYKKQEKNYVYRRFFQIRCRVPLLPHYTPLMYFPNRHHFNTFSMYICIYNKFVWEGEEIIRNKACCFGSMNKGVWLIQPFCVRAWHNERRNQETYKSQSLSSFHDSPSAATSIPLRPRTNPSHAHRENSHIILFILP